MWYYYVNKGETQEWFFYTGLIQVDVKNNQTKKFCIMKHRLKPKIKNYNLATKKSSKSLHL